MNIKILSVFFVISVSFSISHSADIKRSQFGSNQASKRHAQLELKSLSEEQAGIFLKAATDSLFLNDFGVAISFVHRPFSSNIQVSYKGFMFGTQNDSGIYKRLVLIDDQQRLLADFIFHKGDVTAAWKYNPDSGQFDSLSLLQLQKPIVGEIVFRPIDLLMPYMQWGEYDYVGPDIIGINTLVQKFHFINSEDETMNMGFGDSVELLIDSKFKAIRRIGYLSEEQLEKELSAAGFKKIRGVWFVSRLVFKDLIKSESSILRILDRLENFENKSDGFFDPMKAKAFDLSGLKEDGYLF